jgi:hypothetical protein
VNDQMDDFPIVVALSNDSASFHVWNRVVKGDTLNFEFDKSSGKLVDSKYKTTWDWTGRCEDGPLKGEKLNFVQAYQEYWHSWKTFHPNTSQYKVSTN